MSFYCAQVNIGRILGPMDSPVMAEFAASLDAINALAEQSAGFIWRLKDDDNNATAIRIFDDDFLIINMSVWEDIPSLSRYVYQSTHIEYLRRRKEWFSRLTEMHMALWWIPAGEIPTPGQAVKRLEHLRRFGVTPYAFLFKSEIAPGDYEPVMT